ncbi:hypothetical protein QEN35_21075 [Gordonia alkanivorans]|uniref:hypothetical protein n=1 Tax=Gordonia TaxID=2053 RepID=UPI001E312998|nr:MULTISPECIES: hypothetical protein [Gordonia]MDH3026852.1 hypothetical protein [Gordonia alkanivorans]
MFSPQSTSRLPSDRVAGVATCDSTGAGSAVAESTAGGDGTIGIGRVGASDAGTWPAGADVQTTRGAGATTLIGAVTVHESRMPDPFASGRSVQGLEVVVIAPSL